MKRGTDLRSFSEGDPVVFHKTKYSLHPGPRAESVAPSSHGDQYSYVVRKFWRVVDLIDNRVLVETRRGKRHWLKGDDPSLRAPTLWEKVRYGSRFPNANINESRITTGS